LKHIKDYGGRFMGINFKVTLDEVLKNRDNMTQKELIELIFKKTEKKVRPAAVSELYNNQRKSLNIELVELIAEVLEITDVNELISFEVTGPK
jgi:putative transcriptional regulator